MLEDQKFSDVVFLLEDGQEKLEAHKLILCSASNFFRQILDLPNTTKVKIRVRKFGFRYRQQSMGNMDFVTGNNQWEIWISLDFNFRGLNEPRNRRKLEPYQ
jgi:hypothetical protein